MFVILISNDFLISPCDFVLNAIQFCDASRDDKIDIVSAAERATI